MAAAPDPEEVLRSTKGKDNFQLLARLLISGGTSLLREVFDQMCPPSNLPPILKNPATEKRLKGANLTKPQWDSLYPSPGVYGKSADFDVTLLFRLLSTICSLTPPATGWKAPPASTDRSLAADLLRIRDYRNSVYGHVNQNMEITDDEFPSLWQGITEVLVRIAGQISLAKKQEWQKAVDAFLKDSLTAEDERNVQELRRWYENDTEVKQSIEKLKTLTLEGMGRLERSVKDVQEKLEGTAHVIEEKGQFLESTVQEKAKGIKDHLGGELQTTAQNVQNLVREEAQDIKGELNTKIQNVSCLVREQAQATTQNVQCLVHEEAQGIKDQLGGELKTTTKNFQCLVQEESQEIKGELNRATQNVQSLVREEAQDVKDQLGGELEATSQNVQSLVRDEAQEIKGELQTNTQNVESVVREEAQAITDKLDEMHQSIDMLRSTAGSSQPAGVQIRLRMDCEAISGPGPREGASEVATTSREPQPSVQSATVVPVTPYQQASPIAGFRGDNVAYADLPPTQGILNSIAHRYFQVVDPSTPEELNGFLQYLKEVRNVLVVDTHQGSLIITLECRSLQILEELWEDYCSGLLNEMAQKYLVTEEILEEFGLTAVKLKLTILNEEYRACRQYFTQLEVDLAKYYTKDGAKEEDFEVEEFESFSVAARNLEHLLLESIRSYMKIVVKMPDGRMIPLKVEPSSTVKFVKQIIEKKEGIPFYQQHLTFVSTILEDDNTLTDYNIEEESTLHLVLSHTAMLIFIIMPIGNAITTLTCIVEPETLIRNVKKKIENIGIFPDDQRLIFAGQELEDDQTLEEYHIKHNSILQLRGPKVMKVFISVSMPTKKLITLEVDPETSIRNVKEKIEQKSGFLIDQQHLFSGNQELANERSLKDYNVQEKISLYLTEDLKRQCSMRVYLITPTGKTTSLVVLSSESVESVKNKIYDNEGIPPNEQRLTFDGEELTYGSLIHYQIKNDSVLRLVRRPPPANHCFIKMPTGKMIRLEVKLETSIKEVKLNVQDKEGIPVDQQHLIFRGEELADERTLKDCSIPKDATLHLKLSE